MTDSLTVAISPCPNDTTIFGAWTLGLIAEFGLPPVRYYWEDVEELNRSAAAERFDVVKLSAATALTLTDTYDILPCGGAFGTGAGPKLVARPGASAAPKTIAVPGLGTTAFAVLSAALKHAFTPLPMVFDEIVDAVTSGNAEAGLLIHETALVYAKYDLELRLDLGAWWNEQSGGTPLPLGVIGVRKSLQKETRTQVTNAIRASLTHATAQPADIRPLIKALAQELDDETLDAHIKAYVDDFSMDMGAPGRTALDTLAGFIRNQNDPAR